MQFLRCRGKCDICFFGRHGGRKKCFTRYLQGSGIFPYIPAFPIPGGGTESWKNMCQLYGSMASLGGFADTAGLLCRCDLLLTWCVFVSFYNICTLIMFFGCWTGFSFFENMFIIADCICLERLIFRSWFGNQRQAPVCFIGREVLPRALWRFEQQDSSNDLELWKARSSPQTETLFEFLSQK